MKIFLGMLDYIKLKCSTSPDSPIQFALELMKIGQKEGRLRQLFKVDSIEMKVEFQILDSASNI